jgi:glycosyltransferase involved in cell wall biosynthesis
MTRRLGLLLASRPGDGGVYQYSLTVLQALRVLAARGWQVEVVCAHASWDAAVVAAGFDVIACRAGSGARLLAWLWPRLRLPVALGRRLLPWLHPLPRLLARSSCALWIFPAQDRWAYLAPVVALSSVHDLMHRYERRFPEFSGTGLYSLREAHYGMTSAWCAGILVDSECGKQQMIESYGTASAKIHPLPYVPPAVTPASPAQLAEARARYTLPERYFFYPAQFWPHKNHARLLRALAKARRAAPDMCLVLTGGRQREYGALVALRDELGLGNAVSFLGYVPAADLPALYQQARALVMPTFFGPTNLPPLEAMALGCPVAVSGIYAMPERLGDAATYFDPESGDSLCDAMLHLWRDDALCARLREAGLQRMAQWQLPQFADLLERQVEATLRASAGCRP